jgi:hypothetical protein
MTKMTMVSTSFSNIGHFDGHGGPPVQYKVHHSMQHVKDYSRSHWTPPSGNYLLSISPAAARATGKQKQSTNTPKQVAMLMAAAVRWYNTACIALWRRSRALLEATGCRHRASIMSDNINWTWLRRYF